MRHAIPRLPDQADDLKPRRPPAHDGHQKPRLQRLDLLASGQAQTRQDVAHRLGVPRHPIGRWLALAAAGGLDARLAISVPAGKPLALAPAVLASLEQARHRPAGLAADAALRPWVRHPPGVEVKDPTRYALVRPRLRAKLPVPRPSHTTQA